MTQPVLTLGPVARSRNGVIGRDGGLPWRLSDDLKRFKALTLGKPIIMGRKTWQSLPKRPLPGRLNLVLTRDGSYETGGAVVCETFTDLDSALTRAEQWAREQGVDELMLIGGAQLYAQALPQAQRLYLTRIEASPEGDAFFPDYDQAEWQCIDSQAHPAEGDAPAYRFETWQRR